MQLGQFGSDSDSDDSDVTQYKAVTCIGQQPGSDVIVIGPELQLSSDGILIPVEQQEYVWIPNILVIVAGCQLHSNTLASTDLSIYYVNCHRSTPLSGYSHSIERGQLHLYI